MSDKESGSPPFRPDLSLVTYLDKARSEDEMRAIFEESEDPPAKEPAPEKTT